MPDPSKKLDPVKAAAIPPKFAVDPAKKAEWNKFIDYIQQNYPKGVQDEGDDPTPAIVESYRKVNPNTPISSQNIKDFQRALVEHNNKWIQLQPNYNPNGGYIQKTSPIDNRIGSVTSKAKFPVVDFGDKKFGTDIDNALSYYEQNVKGSEPYIDPTLTTQQRFQQNQLERIKAAKEGRVWKPKTVREYEMEKAAMQNMASANR